MYCIAGSISTHTAAPTSISNDLGNSAQRPSSESADAAAADAGAVVPDDDAQLLSKRRRTTASSRSARGADSRIIDVY